METRKEFRFLEQPELRASAGNTLEGHAAVFNQWSRDLGGFREKILPGAFARSIREDNVVALWSHDQHSIPLARNKSGSLELSEDSIGLRTIIHLPDTALARDYLEQAVAAQPDCLAVLKLHYLRWVLFPIKGDTYFMYQGIFDTDFDKYTEDAVNLFGATGLKTVFENLEGFPADWQTNAPAFVKFVREHQCPSFLEYGEYPYVSADEIKKALKLKAAFSNMLDQMQ
jgi:hypothetical protein